MNRYVLLLILLTIMSIATLVQSVISEENVPLFIAATSISHIALFVTGYFYYRRKAYESLRDLRNEIIKD